MKYMLLIHQGTTPPQGRRSGTASPKTSRRLSTATTRQSALELVHSDAERGFLEQRLAELEG
jgi:hypothetical protein